MLGDVVGKVRIKLHSQEVGSLLQDAMPVIRELTQKVLQEAKATARNDRGSETLQKYFQAGFSSKIEPRSKRPRGVVSSNADGDTALRAQFAYQYFNGFRHLNEALYKHVPKTKRGGRRR